MNFPVGIEFLKVYYQWQTFSISGTNLNTKMTQSLFCWFEHFFKYQPHLQEILNQHAFNRDTNL